MTRWRKGKRVLLGTSETAQREGMAEPQLLKMQKHSRRTPITGTGSYVMAARYSEHLAAGEKSAAGAIETEYKQLPCKPP